MSDDLLESAARALKDETAEGDSGAKFTRARVMASLHHSQVRRRTRLAFVLPIAACFAAASAFGMASGRAPALFDSVKRALGFEEQREAPTPPPAPRPAHRPASPAEPFARAPSAPPAPAASDEPPATQAPSARPDAAAARHATSPAPSASAKRDIDPAHELYRAAHQAHFSEHDYGRALAHWEAYLQRAPRGRFAIEAEYNRALCLARLGRNGEARRALEPFARGERGGYRKRDASELVDVLSE